MMQASYTKHTLIFKQPAGTSRGVLTQKDVYYLKLADASDPTLIGIGEIAPIPGLSPDAVPGLQKKIKAFTEKINKGGQIQITDFDGFPALEFAHETALRGFTSGSPLVLFPSEFTSGVKGIPINGLIWMGTKEFLLKQIQEKLEVGYKCLKLKIGAIGFSNELSVLQSIRDHFSAKELEIRVDANGAFSPEEAMSKLEQLAVLDLHSIEQPVRAGQFDTMRKLCLESPIPIALDEELIGIRKNDEKQNLLDYVKPQYIVLKPSLTGGIKASEEWIQLAKERGISSWVTSALESNIGLNAIAQWVATLNYSMYQGLGTGALFTNNIQSPLYILKGMLYYGSNTNWNIERIS